MKPVVVFMPQMQPVSDCPAQERHPWLTEIVERIMLIFCLVLHDVICAGAEDVRIVVPNLIEKNLH